MRKSKNRKAEREGQLKEGKPAREPSAIRKHAPGEEVPRKAKGETNTRAGSECLKEYGVVHTICSGAMKR